MAEYYPLLARAVAGMRQAPPAQRQAIYDRARQALLGQLRSMQPPVPEASIERESRALDEAIARVEADLIAPPAPAEGPLPAAAPPQPPGEAAPAPDPQPAVAEPERARAKPPRPASVAEPAEPPSRPADPPATPSAPRPAPARPEPEPEPARAAEMARPKTPVPVVPTPAAPTIDLADAAVPPLAPTAPRATGGRPAAEALSRIVAERGRPAPVIRAVRGDGPAPEPLAAAPADVPPSQTAPLPIAPRLEVPSFAAAMAAAAATDAAAGPEQKAASLPTEDEPAPVRDEGLRPPAPRPTTPERFNPRALILSAVALAVIAGIGLAAWRLRDRPEQLAKARAALLAAQQAEQNSRTKISNRADNADGTAAPAASTGGVVVGNSTAPAGSGDASPAAAAAPAASSAAPAAATSAPAPATASPAVPTTATAPQPTASVNPGIPVAQRAAFLVDAPDEPSKIKTYEGTVLWSTDNAAAAADQPLSRTVHAEVDIPAVALKLSFVFQKNYEAQFPASHTLELHFTLGPGNTLGPIKQISVPEMRKDDTPTGDPLIGLPVTITENYFLVGLSRGEPEARNLDLIKTRNWFDVPLMMVSGKVAKITFEKGTTGERAINDVIQSWQQQ